MWKICHSDSVIAVMIGLRSFLLTQSKLLEHVSWGKVRGGSRRNFGQIAIST